MSVRPFVTRSEAAAQGANPAAAWTPPPGALKSIAVMLSPLAPGCEGMTVADDGRWRFLCWRTPAAALRLVLRRLRRTADQVAIRAIDGLPGLEIHDGSEPPPSGCARLLAIIFDAPVPALRTALAALRGNDAIETPAVEAATVLPFGPRGA